MLQPRHCLYSRICGILILVLTVLCLNHGALGQQINPSDADDTKNAKLWIKVNGDDRPHGVVLDAGWRWLYNVAKQSCDASMDEQAAEQCFLMGLDDAQYRENYGVFVANPTSFSLKLRYAARGKYNTAPNYGQRVYLTDGNGYTMFQPMGGELSFTVDLSNVPVGMNAAVYLVSMNRLGHYGSRNPSGAMNGAGWKRGVGYCDAQCPTDLKFVQSQGFNKASRFSSCCSEMDLFEANRFTTAMTAHPCKSVIETVCDNSIRSDCSTDCDSDGADRNLFREKGPGSALFQMLDATRPFRVRTLFRTNDGSPFGDLISIDQIFEQDGKYFVMNITDELAAVQKSRYQAPNMFASTGGVKQMGEALKQGMVMAIALWSDAGGNMNWLDSCSGNKTVYDCSQHSLFNDVVFADAWKTRPGLWRGPADFFQNRSTSFDQGPVTFSYPPIPISWKTQSKFTCDNCDGPNPLVTCDCSHVPYNFVVSDISLQSALSQPAGPSGPGEETPQGQSSSGPNLTWLWPTLGAVATFAACVAAAVCCVYNCNEDDDVTLRTLRHLQEPVHKKHLNCDMASTSSSDDDA